MQIVNQDASQKKQVALRIIMVVVIIEEDVTHKDRMNNR